MMLQIDEIKALSDLSADEAAPIAGRLATNCFRDRPLRTILRDDGAALPPRMTRERDMSMDQIVEGCSEVECDVLVIGGGTAGPMAALKAKLKNPKATVILLEKAM
jgi:NADPH-dependent 2,4-dienoyl-CoA reductase/sulfur reductase-like enzyme